MAYGIELRTSDGRTQISQENPTLVVREKHTIDTSDWVTGSFIYFEYILTLNTTYSAAPLIGVRSTTGGNVVRPVLLTNSSGLVDRVQFYARDRHDYQVIVIASPSSSQATDGSTYGLRILPLSGSTPVFDSRWTANVSVQQITELSAAPSTTWTVDNVGNPRPRHTFTLPYNNQNAFICLDNSFGEFPFSYSGGVGTPPPGEVYVPSARIESINSFSVGLESIRATTGGSSFRTFRGVCIILRFENF